MGVEGRSLDELKREVRNLSENVMEFTPLGGRSFHLQGALPHVTFLFSLYFFTCSMGCIFTRGA